VSLRQERSSTHVAPAKIHVISAFIHATMSRQMDGGCALLLVEWPAEGARWKEADQRHDHVDHAGDCGFEPEGRFYRSSVRNVVGVEMGWELLGSVKQP